ncbi:putative pectate lyase F [Stachybotrys elegans]|uniref:Pectate lyase n=1 Tax=Stachybotrys elegans TaxID=80388 RepID=A0A8K0SPI3_9HYPO|nr:putative pectate lyase F [Stachybotrys elegans]
MLLQTLLVAVMAPLAMACKGYEGGLPVATARQTNSRPITVRSGQVYDGGWKLFDRGSGACGSGEGGDSDAVFLVEAGGTLRNVIIGRNQHEGVHCLGPCTLEFVWFEDVCEDAITIKGDRAGQHSWIIGGGAFRASDKIVQHNGCGTVNIINFYANDYGKVYRSCGNCSSQCKRNVYIEGVTARNGGEVAGINRNYGDTATLINVCTDARTPCQMYDGCAGGCEPTKVGACPR